MFIKIIQKIIITTLAVYSFSIFNMLFAQGSTEITVAKILNRYDSLDYLTFDVKYTYSTDTVKGDFKHNILYGSYTLAGKKAFYHLGDIQYMQNDSFLISVYNKDKIIIVEDPPIATGSQLPLSALIDSLALTYSQHYQVSTSTDSIFGTISFVRTDSIAQYDQFSIKYDTTSNFLTSLEFDYSENKILESDDSTLDGQTITHKYKLIIDLSNYRIDNFSDRLYHEYNYIWLEDGKWKPVEKYRDYQVYYSRSPIERPHPNEN